MERRVGIRKLRDELTRHLDEYGAEPGSPSQIEGSL